MALSICLPLSCSSSAPDAPPAGAHRSYPSFVLMLLCDSYMCVHCITEPLKTIYVGGRTVFYHCNESQNKVTIQGQEELGGRCELNAISLFPQ